MNRLLIMLLCLGAGLWAEPEVEPDPEPFTEADALYAPEEATGTAGTPLSFRSSYYSQARILAFDIADPGRQLAGAEFFLDDKLVGYSPLTLSGFLVSQEYVALSARAPGYEEALRPRMHLPREGEVRVAFYGERATRWYSWGAGALGLAAIGASLAAYGQNTPESGTLGAGLLVGGISVIAVTQVVARFFHIPAMRRQAEAHNQKAEPAP